MVWGLVLYLRAFSTSSDSVASLVCLVPVETRRAVHDSHRLLADHNGRAVHDRSRYRHGSSRSECPPQSATGFSLFISFHHFSRPSCPVRLRRLTSSGKLDFLGDEFPVSSSTALCPQCFNMFRAHLFFHCGCESITSSSLAGAVIILETVSRSGTARTSSTGAKFVGAQRGPVKLIGVFLGDTAGGLRARSQSAVLLFARRCPPGVGFGVSVCVYLSVRREGTTPRRTFTRPRTQEKSRASNGRRMPRPSISSSFPSRCTRLALTGPDS